jgi:hypothetical protein
LRMRGAYSAIPCGSTNQLLKLHSEGVGGG